MAKAKVEIPADKLVDTHKPKHFKYKYILKDDKLVEELSALKYDFDTLDTINNDILVEQAMNAEYQEYDRVILGKAKEPTVLKDGVIISRKMVAKADAKLLSFNMGFFDYDDRHYIALKACYERFDIIEIFILT